LHVLNNSRYYWVVAGKMPPKPLIDPKTKPKIPGTIFKDGSRYYWFIPRWLRRQRLVPKGEKFSAKDRATAEKVALDKWKQIQGPSDPDINLRSVIQNIALEFPRYGYRRMTRELCRRGIHVNHKKVLRIMREDNLLCIRKSFKPKTTNSNHSNRVYPNLARDMELTGLNQLWVADITYVRLQNEFVYLAVILDVFSRKCIGWELSRDIDTQLALNALNMALQDRNHLGFEKLTHHSDQGVQYTSNEYVETLKNYGIVISMSRKGNPYDNAFAESFIKTLKTEEVNMNEYETFKDAYRNIKTFIEDVYNKKRLHSSIGYRPPNEFEKEVFYTCVA